jgi:hypothetical protein
MEMENGEEREKQKESEELERKEEWKWIKREEAEN